MFGLNTIGDGDTISLYKFTEILSRELGTSGIDFTEGINKFVLSLLAPGSRSEVSFKLLIDAYDENFKNEKGKNENQYRKECVKDMLF